MGGVGKQKTIVFRVPGAETGKALQLRVLLVEDDPMLADGLMRSLKQADYTVDWTADGEEAEAILRIQEFDLVVLDLTLPHMDGLEILRMLRSHKVPVPVLIITARSEVDDRIKGFENVPTAKEKGADFAPLMRIRGLAAPKGTPQERIAYLREAFQSAFNSAGFQEHLRENSLDLVPYPDDPVATINEQVEIYKKGK